jgi:hypothetical protein
MAKRLNCDKSSQALGRIQSVATRTFRQIACLLGTALLAQTPGSLFAQSPVPGSDAPKWGPHIDFEVKPGTRRSLGEADLFVPLAQDGRTLYFGNLRGRFDDRESREGNLGAGVRRMYASGWNFGAYGYYDRRRSSTGNYFNQVTLGGEALGRDWDFRGNIYLPQGDRIRNLGTTGGGAPFAAISGSTVQIITPGSATSEERALKGHDAEIGWRLPVFDADNRRQLRFYAGGFRFSDKVVEVSGPRVRLEYTAAELSGLWDGAQLVVSAEAQNDNARGDQAFLGVRLRVPLGNTSKAPRLTAQERRMTAAVMRDVDIVTQSRVSAATPQVVETATTVGGQPVVVLNSASTPDLPAAIALAGFDSTVILSGTFTPTAPTFLVAGQTVMGAGTLTLTSPSGRTAVLTTPAATVNATTASNNAVFSMVSGTTLRGLTINNTGTGNINGVNVGSTNTTIVNNTITATSTNGGLARALFSSSVNTTTITGNTLNANSPGGVAIAYNASISSFTFFANNTVAAYGSGGANDLAVDLNFYFVSPGSTGNIRVNGICAQSNRFGGSSIVFTDGSSCP